MASLSFVLQFASVRVVANMWCNGFLVATSLEKVVAVRRRLEPFMIAGRNFFELELVEPPPPSGTDEEEPALEASLHLLGPDAEPHEHNALVSYAFTPGEVAASPDYQTVLRHVVGIGEVAKPRVWEKATPIADEQVGPLADAGLAGCRAALEQGAVAELIELATQDQADITGTSTDEALEDLTSDLRVVAAGEGAIRVDIAGRDDLVTALFGVGRVIQLRTRSGRPPVIVRGVNASAAFAPAFSVLDGRVRVVRWS